MLHDYPPPPLPLPCTTQVVDLAQQGNVLGLQRLLEQYRGSYYSMQELFLNRLQHEVARWVGCSMWLVGCSMRELFLNRLQHEVARWVGCCKQELSLNRLMTNPPL